MGIDDGRAPPQSEHVLGHHLFGPLHFNYVCYLDDGILVGLRENYVGIFDK